MRLMTDINRRRLLLSLPGLAHAPRPAPTLLAQAAPAPRVRGINHIGLASAGAKRSLEI